MSMSCTNNCTASVLHQLKPIDLCLWNSDSIPPVVHVTSTSDSKDGEASSLYRRNGTEHHKHRFFCKKTNIKSDATLFV